MTKPTCPKCKGRITLLPEGTYDTPTIKCTCCGWMLQKERAVEKPLIKQEVPNKAKSGGAAGGQKRQQILRETTIRPTKKDAYVSTQGGSYVHVYKEQHHSGKAKSFCGVTGTKRMKAHKAVCKTCLKNYENYHRRLNDKGTSEEVKVGG